MKGAPRNLSSPCRMGSACTSWSQPASPPPCEGTLCAALPSSPCPHRASPQALAPRACSDEPGLCLSSSLPNPHFSGLPILITFWPPSFLSSSSLYLSAHLTASFMPSYGLLHTKLFL